MVRTDINAKKSHQEAEVTQNPGLTKGDIVEAQGVEEVLLQE